MIHPNVKIPASASIGHGVIIEEGVQLGENIQIGHYSILHAHTIIGSGVRVGHHSILGVKPHHSPLIREVDQGIPPLQIGSNSTIGHHVTLYAGSTMGQQLLIADHVHIREQVEIGDKTVIGRGVMIELNSRIGKQCTVQTLCYITGDTILEDHVFLGPAVAMANDKYMKTVALAMTGPYLEQGVRIGSHATLLPGVRIGARSMVGAGAVVTRNIPADTVVMGNPARERGM